MAKKNSTDSAAPEIQIVPIGQIMVNPNNPRTITDKRFTDLVRSIREFPQMLYLRPIVVDPDGIILGGNMRYQAAREAGLSQVPIIFADQLTQDQMQEFIIKDNVGFGAWDWDVLVADWDQKALMDWGLEIPDLIIKGPKEAREDRFNIDPDIVTDIRVGDMYQVGRHRIICADSRHVAAWSSLFGKERAALCFTDPPYGVSYTGVDNASGHKWEEGIQNDDLRGNALHTFLQLSFANMHTFLQLSFANMHTFLQDNAATYVFHASKNQVHFELALN